MESEEKVFNEMKKEYVKILHCLYPSKGSAGFTERNLSVNYITAYKRLNEKAVVWFEFPFGEGKHFDAVILDPPHKKLFIVESKRFSNPEEKANDIGEDIQRIQSMREDEQAETELGERIENWEEYTIIGVIVADVWTETDKKKAVYNYFYNQDFYEGIFDKCENLNKLLKEENTVKCFTEKFDTEDSRINHGHAVTENYKLIEIQWVVREKKSCI